MRGAALAPARPPLLGRSARRSRRRLAEGRGFEPPRDLLGPYPISSRTPSTGLGHPSASTVWNAHGPRDDHGGYCLDLIPSRICPLGPNTGSIGLPVHANIFCRVLQTYFIDLFHTRIWGCPSRRRATL